MESDVSKFLLALTVGPVQEFIAAARRTRDLWFGSYLLSEISRAVAAASARHGQLIFPASADAPNVANVILLEIFSGEKPAVVAHAAKEAAQQQWRSFADPVFTEYRRIIGADIWDDQVEDVLEFYAAWVEFTGSYPEARARVMRLLAGRKNCRDFLPAKGRPGVPKSSLDGLRESVLKDKESWPEKYRARLRVRPGEQLDVVALVKRAAEGTIPFPSVSRVAADPWVRGRLGQLTTVIEECEKLGNSVVRKLNLSEEIGHPHYASFPFEGSALFLNRHHELVQETEIAREALLPLAKAVARLGVPNPYLAVIIADGDKMGETISKLTSAEDNRAFSTTLAEFAAQAHVIVHTYNGVLVYAGGDDVLAFVPVDHCLVCARALHDTFGTLLKDWGRKAGTNITLSVGVAIGHFLENLEDLREYGQAAEKDAKKPDRDGLAIHLYKRGGSPIALRMKWTDARPKPEQWADAPDTRITRLAVMLHQRSLPTRLATDLYQMADVYDSWPNNNEAETTQLKEAIERDVLRVILSKQPGRGDSVHKQLEVVLQRVADAAALRQLAEELLIARQIATASRQAAGQTSGDNE